VFYAPVNFYNDYVMNLLGPSGNYIYQFATDVNHMVPGTNIPSTAALWNLAVSRGIPVPQLTAADVEGFGFTVGPGQPGRVEVIPGKNFQGVHSVQASQPERAAGTGKQHGCRNCLPDVSRIT
jgi:hypothetical protein